MERNERRLRLVTEHPQEHPLRESLRRTWPEALTIAAFMALFVAVPIASSLEYNALSTEDKVQRLEAVVAQDCLRRINQPAIMVCMDDRRRAAAQLEVLKVQP